MIWYIAVKTKFIKMLWDQSATFFNSVLSSMPFWGNFSIWCEANRFAINGSVNVFRSRKKLFCWILQLFDRGRDYFNRLHLERLVVAKPWWRWEDSQGDYPRSWNKRVGNSILSAVADRKLRSDMTYNRWKLDRQCKFFKLWSVGHASRLGLERGKKTESRERWTVRVA